MANRLLSAVCLAAMLHTALARHQTPQTPPRDAGPAQAAQDTPAASAFALSNGTPVKLKVARDLSSATEKPGALVDFEVVEEVTIGETVVIPRGSLALGKVIAAQPKRRMGRTGKLEVGVESVRLASGETAPLRATQTAPDGSRVGTVTTVVVASGILFFPAAPLFLLIKGKDIFIPKGTLVTAYINGDVPLDVKKFGPADGPQKSAALAAIVIRSTPDGAEIKVGEKYVGHTPSTLHLAPGEHALTIQKQGFKPWQRTITTGPGGSVTVEAELEADGGKQQ
jgi:hypothetical protein